MVFLVTLGKGKFKISEPEKRLTRTTILAAEFSMVHLSILLPLISVSSIDVYLYQLNVTNPKKSLTRQRNILAQKPNDRNEIR